MLRKILSNCRDDLELYFCNLVGTYDELILKLLY